MAARMPDVIKSLMRMGVMATPVQAIDADTAELVVQEFGHRVRRVSESDVELGHRRRGGCGHRAGVAGACGDDHGACRPWQDELAGCAAVDGCCERGGGRDHAAYRRLHRC